MADNTSKPTDQDDKVTKDQPQTGGKSSKGGESPDMEKAQEEAAEEREDEGGYQ